MVGVQCPVAPTGLRILAAMLRHRDLGIDGMDRHALAEYVKADPGTVHKQLRGFIGAGWVSPYRSVDPNTGGPCPTIYRLTDDAPTLDELLGIEAVV